MSGLVRGEPGKIIRNLFHTVCKDEFSKVFRAIQRAIRASGIAIGKPGRDRKSRDQGTGDKARAQCFQLGRKLYGFQSRASGKSVGADFRNGIGDYNAGNGKIIFKCRRCYLGNGIIIDLGRYSYRSSISGVFCDGCSESGDCVLKITESVGIGAGRGNTSVVKFRFLCRSFVSRFFLR